MSETKSKINSIKSFLKKYLYYVILVATIFVAIAIIVIAGSTSKSNSQTSNVSNNAVTFTCPVSNASIIKGFSSTELQYNSTLNVWETHKAIDFSATAGDLVYACHDAIVDSIYSNYLEGTVIVLKHSDTLKSVYKSLDADVSLVVGDKVSSGDVIGKVGNTSSSENSLGAHVHFEIWQDGNKVDPSNYLDLDSSNK